MKQQRSFPFAVVSKKQAQRLQQGHPWVYDEEILSMHGEIENGGLVDVKDEKETYLGTGLFSVASKIRIRILSKNANESFDRDFFERRVHYAVTYRRQVMPDEMTACRLIHGEADGLPGVTIDRYQDVLVSEIFSYGMEQRKQWLYDALRKELPEIQAIYERNEGSLRKKEGLPSKKGWYKDANHETKIWIEENEIFYEVDVENGQKTGFFLDQKYNRKAVREIAKDKIVLDCCTHTGSFALNALKGGAKKVVALDISNLALEMAKKNAIKNRLEKDIVFMQADVFDYLQQAFQNHETYDLIILDPPAFTKSHRTFNQAYRGYERINTMAMKILRRGGYLCSASCSHFMPTDVFKTMLKDAGNACQKQIKIVEERHASKDHPVLLSVPETDYLKFFIVQVF